VWSGQGVRLGGPAGVLCEVVGFCPSPFGVRLAGLDRWVFLDGAPLGESSPGLLGWREGPIAWSESSALFVHAVCHACLHHFQADH